MKTIFYLIKNDINYNNNFFVNDFLFYDSFNKKFLVKPKILKKDKIIIPIFIRQEFYSHMFLVIKFFDVLYYYDPSNKLIIENIKKYIIKETNIGNIKYISFNSIKKNCGEKCLDLLRNKIDVILK